MFKRKPKKPMPTTTHADPLKRLNNLEKARMRVRMQLENPSLEPTHRPRIEMKLASMSQEIEDLKEIVLWS